MADPNDRLWSEAADRAAVNCRTVVAAVIAIPSINLKPSDREIATVPFIHLPTPFRETLLGTGFGKAKTVTGQCACSNQFSDITLLFPESGMPVQRTAMLVQAHDDVPQARSGLLA